MDRAGVALARADWASPPSRTSGYAPIRDYAAIGDGRTVALVARDGSIDWLCLPNLDSPSVFGALLDARRGGRFALEPDEPYAPRRRYLEDTNVLETTLESSGGVVRVTDAMTLPDGGLAPLRELVRRVQGLAGTVPMRWIVEPRFGYAERQTRIDDRTGVPMATAGTDALAVRSWGAGAPSCSARGVEGRFELQAGETAAIVLAAAHQEPLVLPGLDDVWRRLDGTISYWRRWAAACSYDGPWRDEVIRSALALKLLVYAPSGAIAAAPTASLPETIGGGRNWDYRYSWVRDSAFTLHAFLELGSSHEAHSFFWWLLQASQRTHPTLQVLYRLDGGTRAVERELPLDGYLGSSPARIGNDARRQLQLGIYGDLLDTASAYAARGFRIDGETGRRLGETADLVARIWRQPDCGIWEVRSEPRHFTHSKMMCWVALDRAVELAGRALPGRNVAFWRRAAQAIRAFVEGSCYSPERGSYVRFPGSEELDASLVLAGVFGYADPDDPRFRGTLDAVRRELARGPLVYRHRGEDGLEGEEGAFLACSFWVVHALARCGRLEEAAETMAGLLALANDVGLYAEEIEPETGAFLGNMPQGLTHLALVNAAAAVRTAERP